MVIKHDTAVAIAKGLKQAGGVVRSDFKVQSERLANLPLESGLQSPRERQERYIYLVFRLMLKPPLLIPFLCSFNFDW